MKYKYIFFDLDGTLTDSQKGIVNCIKYALESFGINETDESKFQKFLGPPLINSFQKFCGFSKEQAQAALNKYRERFSTIGLFENRVYDGVPEMLQELVNGGHRLVLATSKPLVYAERIMVKYGLRPYFKLLCGAELDGTRDEKAEVIEYAIEKLGCPRDQIIMVGDRENDILGAKKCGIACCGVRYGYAAPGELEAAGADYIADTVEQLGQILLA